MHRKEKREKEDLKLKGGTKKSTVGLILLIFLTIRPPSVSVTTTQSSAGTSSTTAILSVEPPSIVNRTMEPGKNFSINLTLSNVTLLYGLDVNFKWDPELLEYVDHTTKIPVEDYPEGILHEPILKLKDDADAIAGTLQVAYACMHPAQPFNGTGEIFKVTFEVKDFGSCVLEIVRSDLSDNQGTPIPHDAVNGYFTNIPISAAKEKIINADANSVYFIYADPTYMTRAEATYDVASGGIVYGLCSNVQHQGFNTTDAWVLDNGSINSAVINGSTIAMFGGPCPQVAVRHYEIVGLTLARASWNFTHFMFINQTGGMIAALSRSSVSVGHEDMFVMEIFGDRDNTIFIMYGFDWRGTWGAGLFFKEVVSKNLSSYLDSCYVFHWIDDAEQDGVPQNTEISLVASI